MREFYRGRAVLITGGLGFIGSNLAIRLVGLGAQVRVVDARIPGCGANPENTCPVASQIEVIERDIAEASAFRPAIAESQVIFNLAGEVSHIHSMEFPERDFEINALAQLRFLTECAGTAPGVRVIYVGTRQVYGAPKYLPVDEAHPIQPIDFNGVHKHAAAEYHDLLTRSGQIDAIVLRMSNVYGPRMGVHLPCQGFLPVFFRKLLREEPIEIFGSGGQLRDPVYVDDVVDSLLLAGQMADPPSRVYNIGGPKALTIEQIARTVCAVAGVPSPVRREFPEELRAISIGGYVSDCARARRELRWFARTELDEGVAATLEYYRANWSRHQQVARSTGCPLQPAAKKAVPTAVVA